MARRAVTAVVVEVVVMLPVAVLAAQVSLSGSQIQVVCWLEAEVPVGAEAYLAPQAVLGVIMEQAAAVPVQMLPLLLVVLVPKESS